MKNRIKHLGIIVLVSVIGFTMAGCDLSGGNNDDPNNPNAEYSWYGNGSSSSFTISNGKQLQEFAKIVSGTASWTDKDGNYHTIAQSDFRGKMVTLNSDIDMSGISNWVAIGYAWNSYPFNGTFDGNNKIVSGLQQNEFFSYIGEDGTVKNINFVDLNRAGYAGVIETNKGRIQNIGVSGSVRYGAGSWVGGIVSSNSGIVEYCNFSGSISGSYGGTGGIARSNNNGGIIRNCYVSGSITNSGSAYGAGGIVEDNSGTVEGCYSSCSITGGNGTGGIAGTNSGTIKNCYTTGNISDGQTLGGIVGNNNGTIQNCYAIGNVTGSSNIGGITASVGSNNNTVQNCVALNPSITETTTSSFSYGRSGRVSSNEGSKSFLNNYGLKDMSFQTNGSIAVLSNANGIHGANVEASEYNSLSWWTNTLNWDFNTVWQWGTATNLPKLR